VIVFGSSHRIKTMAVAVAFIMAWDQAAVEPGPAKPALEVLAWFRAEVYWSFTRRADALFELCDAVLCAPGRVTDLARLSLALEFRRGHGALYDALNCGHAGFARLRRALAGLPLPAWGDGRIRLAVDVSPWLRPDARASPGRLFCRVKGRGKDAAQSVPGWPYSLVVALGPGRPSWTVPLDAVRLGPDDDECLVTAAQLRDVVTRLIAAGQWSEGDPEIIIAADAGYNATRLAVLLDGLPVIVVARVRADRVFWAPAPPRAPGKAGHPARHGPPVRCSDPATQDSPPLDGQGRDARHGPLTVAAWPRVHQKVHRNTAGFGDWPPGRPFPAVEGTLIRLQVTRPAGGRAAPKPMWLWASVPDAGGDLLPVLWQSYLRRFDIEHTFRFLKQQLGWTRPLLRDPAAADLWTWLLLAAYAQLWIARHLAAATRLPWQPRPPGPAAVTPGQARAGFRRAREIAGTPASPAKPTRPGPGRPKGSKNKCKAPRQPVGKRQLKPSTQRTQASRAARKQRELS
jgi:DDE superfamily endonuclease